MAVTVEDRVVEDFSVLLLDDEVLVVVDSVALNICEDIELVAVKLLVGKVGCEPGGGVGRCLYIIRIRGGVVLS